MREGFRGRFGADADRYRDKLIAFYGPDRGPKLTYAEAFELCEYGRRPSDAEMKNLFPFFGR